MCSDLATMWRISCRVRRSRVSSEWKKGDWQEVDTVDQELVVVSWTRMLAVGVVRINWVLDRF